jgi:hypothetical protein
MPTCDEVGSKEKEHIPSVTDGPGISRIGTEAILSFLPHHLFIMPPSYADKSYWNTRFTKEDSFEWLGDGQATLIPYIENYLESMTKADSDSSTTQLNTGLPVTLHIGAGTSKLSDHILGTYQNLSTSSLIRESQVVIINTDFSEEVVKRAQAAESAEAAKQDVDGSNSFLSAWHFVDALDWANMSRLRSCAFGGDSDAPGIDSDFGHASGFSVVVDKSTSDAISCGEGIHFVPDEDSFHESPLLATVHPEILHKMQTSKSWLFDPLQVLALHLASIVRPRGLWLCLSYSSHRFPFLMPNMSDNKVPDDEADGVVDLEISRFWNMELTKSVEAPSGIEKEGVHTPYIMHYVYLLRRTDVPCGPGR